MEDFNTTRDSLSDWEAKWEKAQADGVFKDAPGFKNKNTHIAPQFYSPIENGDVQGMDDIDAAYWASTPKNGYVDPLENAMLHENVVRVKKEGREALSTPHGELKPTPNPIKPSSIGKDQEYNAAIFDVKEFETLEKAKIELHELEDKIAALIDGKDLQSKVADLKKKIDDLSNVLTYYSDTQTA